MRRGVGKPRLFNINFLSIISSVAKYSIIILHWNKNTRFVDLVNAICYIVAGQNLDTLTTYQYKYVEVPAIKFSSAPFFGQNMR